MRVRARGSAPATGQRGVTLFVALILLVAMTLAGIALMRSVTGGLMSTDNLRLKKVATGSANAGIEQGRAWVVQLLASGASLDADNVAQGYFSSWGNPVWDPFAHDWSNSRDGGKDAADNRIRYVMHRMCQTPNQSTAAANQSCALATVDGSGSTKGAACYGKCPPFKTSSAPYYRVTARVDGPKNTVSYVQTMLAAQ